LSSGAPLKDRRTAADAPAGALRKLKGAMSRPIEVSRRGGKLAVALVERRRERSPHHTPEVELLCAELAARLAISEAEAQPTPRQLVMVHDALERSGWPGLEGFSSAVLGEAMKQAREWLHEQSSPHLDRLIDGLRPLRHAAAQREALQARAAERDDDSADEPATDYAGLEDATQDWSGTLPAELMPTLERDD
jgi:hypothetical protein